jgi:hypothetical protein
MSKYRITLNLGKNLGIIEYEEENEEIFKEKLATIFELRNIASDILSKQEPILGTEEYPNISSPQDLGDAILKLLAHPSWGKIPRTLNEIHSALAFNSIHVTKETLGSKLAKMKRKGKVSRTKKGKFYAYSLPLGHKD